MFIKLTPDDGSGPAWLVNAAEIVEARPFRDSGSEVRLHNGQTRIVKESLDDIQNKMIDQYLLGARRL